MNNDCSTFSKLSLTGGTHFSHKKIIIRTGGQKIEIYIAFSSLTATLKPLSGDRVEGVIEMVNVERVFLNLTDKSVQWKTRL